jgi:hypothetical protein
MESKLKSIENNIYKQKKSNKYDLNKKIKVKKKKRKNQKLN